MSNKGPDRYGRGSFLEGTLSSHLADRLLDWFARHARDFPWRRDRTPYRVWIAEVMLQQTRTEAMGPYYERFMARFPTLESLARAPREEVLRLWEGLGYYSRARMLHAAAQKVLEERGGELPDTREELQKLPGVGPYIAGAVASIAFGRSEVALDGNACRVLSRLLALEGDPRQPSVRRRLEEYARSMMPPDRPGPFNEALMELGATICLPRRPRCSDCPLADDCQAHQRGQEESLPTRAPRRPLPHYEVTAAVIQDPEGRILLARRKENSFLGGLWEFPGGKREEGESLEECLAREMREELGIEVAVGERLVTLEHGYTHFRITLHVFRCRLVAGVPQCLDCDEVRWVTVEEMAALPMPVTDRRIARMLEPDH
ncbi:MAG: A/G-specific adenine glycosylase [Anaerolineae bacterium]